MHFWQWGRKGTIPNSPDHASTILTTKIQFFAFHGTKRDSGTMQYYFHDYDPSGPRISMLKNLLVWFRFNSEIFVSKRMTPRCHCHQEDWLLQYPEHGNYFSNAFASSRQLVLATLSTSTPRHSVNTLRCQWHRGSVFFELSIRAFPRYRNHIKNTLLQNSKRVKLS